MRTTVLLAACLIVVLIGAGCSEGDPPESATTSTASGERPPGDHRSCEVLQGDEHSIVPEAVEYRGLDGSLRFLRQRSGPNIEGEVFVYLNPDHAFELDERTAEVDGIEGASVVGSLDQDATFEEFVAMFGEDIGDRVIPSILPPLIAVEMSAGDTRVAMEALKEQPWVYDVIFREEVATRLLATVRLVQDQFEKELRELGKSGREEVRDAAEAFRRLGGFGSSPSDFPPDVIAATEPLTAFVDERCPSRALPDP